MDTAFIAKQFDVDGHIVSIEPFGSGNVNDTFYVVCRTTYSQQTFILQRIRRAVFPNPENIMKNMRIVTDICHKKLEVLNEDSDRVWQLPKIIQTRKGEDFYLDSENNLWRAITNIASSVTYDKVQSPEHAYEAGSVLGLFHDLISDIPCESLSYTIEGFHITPRYLKQMDMALETEYAKKMLEHSREARSCLRFINERRDFCNTFEDAKNRGELHLRATHGDPKITNILIDERSGRGTCIVDLDTIQPGLIHADVADAIRSCCNPAGEDAPDLHSVYFDIDIFSALFKGYMKYAKSFFTEADFKYLYDAIRILPLELGIRFFADYLDGDKYFKIRYKGHNLKRALVQLKLVESIEARESQIRKVLGR